MVDRSFWKNRVVFLTGHTGFKGSWLIAMAERTGSKYKTLQITLNNYWRGYWPQHPVQLHLHGLPDEVIVNVISDFVATRDAVERPVKNYAEWLLASFGRTFAELFPMQYTRKYHLTTAENMSTDWLGPRIYRPT